MSKRNREKREHSEVPTLRAAMQQVLDLTVATEKGEESRIAHVHLWAPDGALTLAALAIEGGAQYAAAARSLIATHDVALAVLSCEMWTAKIDQRTPLEQQDWLVRDWLERRARGERLGVVDLPPDYRTESLFLIGETADGLEMDWFVDIKPATRPGGPRRFERRETADAETISSRFRPLFALRWAQRHGVPAHVAREVLVREMEQAGLAPHRP